MAKSPVDDELWDEFHELVNMTSRELEEWLRTDAAQQTVEPLPGDTGHELGDQVVRILGKRRSDLVDDDIQVMRRVVKRVRRERGEEPEPTAGQPAWRHKLMSVGHDPLKPTGEKFAKAPHTDDDRQQPPRWSIRYPSMRGVSLSRSSCSAAAESRERRTSAAESSAASSGSDSVIDLSGSPMRLAPC